MVRIGTVVSCGISHPTFAFWWRPHRISVWEPGQKGRTRRAGSTGWPGIWTGRPGCQHAPQNVTAAEVDGFQEVKFWSAEGDSDSVGFPQTCQSSQTERPQEREEYMAAILSCVGSFFNGSVLPVETRVNWAAAGVKWQETSLDKLIRHCNFERLVKSWQSGRFEGQKKEREGSTPTEAFPGVHCQGRVCRTGLLSLQHFCDSFGLFLAYLYFLTFWRWWGMMAETFSSQSRRLLRFLGRFYSHCPAAGKSWGTIWI